MREGEREIADAARAIGADPDQLLRFARRNLRARGVTSSEFAAALRALFGCGPKLAVCTEELQARVRALGSKPEREAL